MTVPEETVSVANVAGQQRAPARARRYAVAILFAGLLLASSRAFYRRLTCEWIRGFEVPGFVEYGAHEDRFSSDAALIAVARGNECKVLELASGKELSRLAQYDRDGLADFSSDGRVISQFPDEKSDRRAANVWNARDGRLLGSVEAPENLNVTNCHPQFADDGRTILAACPDGVLVWDSPSLRFVGYVSISWPEGVGTHRLMQSNPTTQEPTVVDADGKLLGIDLRELTVRPLFADQTTAVKVATWSPDGTRLAVINRENGSVEVWDAQTGRAITAVPEDDVLSVSFSPDGKEIVTARKRSDVVRTGRRAPPVWDRSTKIWDAASGTLVRDLPTIGIVKLSADWSFWVEAGPEGLRIARIDGSALCSFPEWFDGHGSSSVFAPDNRYLASVNGSGRVCVWMRNDTADSWSKFVAKSEFWMTLFSLAGLTWALARCRTSGASAVAIRCAPLTSGRT